MAASYNAMESKWFFSCDTYSLIIDKKKWMNAKCFDTGTPELELKQALNQFFLSEVCLFLSKV